MMLVAIILSMLFSGVNPLCGGYEKEPCSTHCCCSETKMVCTRVVLFPPGDMKFRAGITNIEMEKSCIPELDDDRVVSLFPCLEEIDFTGTCENCLKVKGQKMFIIKGRTICPDSTPTPVTTTSASTIRSTTLLPQLTSTTTVKTDLTTARTITTTSTINDMSTKQAPAKSTASSTIGLSISLPVIGIACVGVVGLLVWRRIKKNRTSAPTVPPPSVDTLNQIELSILGNRRAFVDQSIQTDVPRIPTIPVPPIPRQTFENEAESGEYESVRDSSETIFEMPGEVHSWQARLFGYPVPDSSQYYNISFVNNSS